MLSVIVQPDSVRFGDRLTVVFQRTLRVPEGGDYPLPPGLGRFPVYRVADHAGSVPPQWLEHDGVFIPMYQREALWLGFLGAPWQPSAVKVAAGGINVLSGEPDNAGALQGDPQDYLVCPEQPWLDGFHTGVGTVRQFVAMPLGAGYSVEAALTGREALGGLCITVFAPRPGRFPDAPPPAAGPVRSARPQSMGLAAGGVMRQKVYPDRHGVDAWDTGSCGRLMVHLVNCEEFQRITGKLPPATPVDPHTYTERGLPWFALYDEAKGDVPVSDRLAGVPSMAERDKVLGRAVPESCLEIDPAQIRTLHSPTTAAPQPAAPGPAEPKGSPE